MRASVLPVDAVTRRGSSRIFTAASITFLTLAALLLVACDDSPPKGAATSGSPAPSTPPAIPRAVHRPEEFQHLEKALAADRLQELLESESISGPIKDVLQDGVLTFSEYQDSVLQMAQCVRDSGGGFLDGYGPTLSSRGLYTYVPSSPTREGLAANSACIVQYVGVLDLFWKELVAPTAAEREAAMDAMADCLGAGGFTGIPSGLTEAEMQDLYAKGQLSAEESLIWLECALRIEDEWGLTYFAPVAIGAAPGH